MVLLFHQTMSESSMISVHVYSDSVHVPVWVDDLESFRRWIHSDEAPEKGPACFLAGDVWIDMSKEQIFSHNQIKKIFSRVISGLEK